MKIKMKLLMTLLTILQAMACESDTKKLNSTTLHIGFNGLNRVSKVNIFENEASVRASWLKFALTPIELETVNPADSLIRRMAWALPQAGRHASLRYRPRAPRRLRRCR